MAQQTPNLGLVKPQREDFVRVKDFNGNSDRLDEIVGDPAQLDVEQRANIVAAINAVIGKITDIQSVDRLPINPDPTILYLIKDYRDVEGS